MILTLQDIDNAPREVRKLLNRLHYAFLQNASPEFTAAIQAGCEMEYEVKQEGGDWTMNARTKHPVDVYRKYGKTFVYEQKE